MKKLLLVTLLLMLGSLAFGQTSLPPCDPNNLPPNCTDYFGVANWANSPLPAGAIIGFTVVSAGGGYASPIAVITDTTGSGAGAPTITLNASGGIATVTGGGGGTGYVAPQVTIVDVGAGGSLAAPLCGALGQPLCGSGALVAAMIGAPLTAGTGIRKFVDTLTLPLANLQLAVADTTTFPGSDYYVIALTQYATKMHTDLPATTLRGYCQLIGTATTCTPSYLGPTILAQKNRPVRVLFKNLLPTSAGGNLFIPVDTTYMGAGPPYTQNRATLHLHGGATPWISDGTPHQWTAPAGEAGPARGDSVQSVPDMWFDATGNVIASCAGQPTCTVAGATNDPGAGNLTFFWTNQQGGRLMFYHDHALGLTRLNVYAGEAAGYLLVDPTEEAALAAATVPGTITGTPDLAHLVPLVIQDKTFVPSAAQLAVEDPTWTAGGFGTTPGVANPGDLWFPHIYTPNQNPADVGGANAFGRWDYGPWTLPGNQTVLLAASPTVGDVTIPCTSSAFPNVALNCPITPNPSGTPESFMDTPLVNGKAYPVLHVAPEAYRFRILSAGNDRSWNLQWYVADPTVTTPDGRANTEVKMVPAIQPAANATEPLCSTLTPITNTTLFMGLATAVLDASGDPINGTGLPGTPAAPCWPNFGAGSQAAGIPIQQTMWAADGRAGGAPDPATAGPPFIQIGTEGGLLPAPVVIPSMPTGYEANTRSVTITNVSVHGLWLGPAERADAIVDFSKFAGKTLILYNDAPTPAPAVDSRLDYFTGDGDQTSIGGAPNTIPGYGPNTRTIMQVVVDAPATGAPPFKLANLQAALPSIFAQTQPVPIVPEPTYPVASGGYSAIPTYSLITDATFTFFPIGSTTPVTYTDERKTIQELFTLDYGRMNATLGVELPLTNFLTQTTIPLGYIDPPTEIIKAGDTQLWHITHNGVDTHFIHFHLFNVQVINRSAWDGTKRPPDQNELGWKDTVRMNPLEDILVALKAIQPLPPFPVRDSYRFMDVTMPALSNCPAITVPTTLTPRPCSIFTNVDPNTNVGTQTPNIIVNFGWEYVWHCHILGHEENDMMRAIAFNVPPEAPSSLSVAAATGGGIGLTLNWTDNSASETGFTLERDTTAAFAAPTLITVGPSSPTDGNGQGITWGGLITYNDTAATGAGPYFYRVQALKPDANYWTPSPNITSAWSNTASFAANSGTPFAAVSPAALAFGSVALLATSAPQTVTLSNTGNAPFTYSTSNLGPNAADFAVVDPCAGTAPANSRCTLSLTFRPTAGGAESAIMFILTSDLLHPALTVSLTGTGGMPLLTISANNVTMRYGSAVPALTFSYTPPNPLGVTAPTCTTLATKTSPVGTYPIACSGATGAYTFTYVPGTVSVTPAPLTIWASNATMPVGGFPPVPPGSLPVITPSYVGFVAGDTAATLAVAPNAAPTCSTTVTLATPVGKYPNSTSCSGAVDPNYTISYVKGSVTVAVSPLTITAPNLTMTYGGPLPALTPTYNPASPAGLTTPAVCTTSATSRSPVGTYPVTCSGAVDPNYTIGYVAGTLTVTQAPLVITAPSPTMPYGGPLPTTLTPTYASFVAGDTAASLTTQPTCTTTAIVSSPVATYPVTCSGAVDANYTISYVAGTLTVNPAVVTVTASTSTMTYGGIVPAITPSYSAFVLGQTNSVLTATPTCSTTATNKSSVSPPTYPSTCSGAVAPNYTFNYVPGAVTIIGAPLTITANNASKVYGTTATFLPTAFTATGLLNGDTLTSVTLTSTGAVATAAVGPYPIVPSAPVGTGLGNYTITYTNGTLTVNPAPLTITAKPASKIYGATLTFLGSEFTATGLLNGDTLTSVTLTSTGAAATAAVGPYPITPSAALGIGLTNYTIAYVNGTLTVTKASTSTTITSNLPNPAIVGQIVTVSFAVAPQFTGTPTGTVQVKASTGETCTGALAAGVGSCPLTFFSGGSRTLTSTYGGDSNFLASLPSATVNQVVSGISLSTSSLLFGDQLMNTTSAPQTVTLSNVGTNPITISSIVWSANFSDSTTCGRSLAPGRSCRINVRFRPITTGVLTGTLTINDSDPTSPQTVTLTGTGVVPINSVSPPALTFNSPLNVTSAAQPVTVTNTGTAPLLINNITRSGPNANQFASNNLNCPIGGTGLAVGATCTINVTFRPTNTTTLTSTASLNVNVSAPALNASVGLTGNLVVPTVGVSGPLAFTSPVNVTSTPQQASITNTGAIASATITNITLAGTNPGQFARALASLTCGGVPATLPVNLAPGASCTINVTFTATSAGTKTANLDFMVAAPVTPSNWLVPLTGN